MIGIAIGPDFGFLNEQAGFQVAEGLLGVSPTDPYFRLILAGVVNTLTVAAVALPLATLLGIALGLLRLTRHPVLYRALAVIVEPIRNTPVLLQLFVWYSLCLLLPGVRQAWQPLPGVFASNRGLAFPAIDGLGAPLMMTAMVTLAMWAASRTLGRTSRHRAVPAIFVLIALAASVLIWTALPAPTVEFPVLKGFGLSGGFNLSPEFVALTAGLIVFHSTYIADIVRGAVLTVPAGQVDAGRALGMGNAALAVRIVYPYAARVAVPPYANQCLMLIKNSTLAIAIGYQELMAIINTVITQTGRAVEGITLAACFYVSISLLLAWALARYNKRMTRHGIEGAGTTRLAQRWGVPGFSTDALFGSPLRTFASAALICVCAFTLFHLLQWSVQHAVWWGSAQDCAQVTGACWAAVTANYPLLMFGTMTPAQRPQAAVACVLLVITVAVWLMPVLSVRWRGAVMVLSLSGAALALAGVGEGGNALMPVAWGGLLVTLAMALATILLSLPLALGLALLRRRPSAWMRWPAVGLIEITRAVPLVTQLLLVSFWVPLLIGGDWSAAKFQLALAALVLHCGSQLAEVLRGALQALPESQTIGAQALGMRSSTIMTTVLLPQAIRIAAPSALGVFVGAIKDTSLVMVIGVFDVLSAAKAVVADTGWRPYYIELYAAVALLYLAICLPLSRYAARMTRGARPASY